MKKLLPVGLFLCMVHTMAASGGSLTAKNSLQVPSSITENAGQLKDESGKPLPDVLAKISIPFLDVYLTRSGMSYVVMSYEEDNGAAAHPVFINEKHYRVKYSRVDVELPGSKITPSQFAFSDETHWKSNYYYGNSQPVKELKHYQTLTIQNIYPNIDCIWKVTPNGKLEYDFVVHPGGDASLIRMKYNYADLKAETNMLRMSTHHGVLLEGPLKAVSANDMVDVAYQLNNATKEISFAVGTYDKSRDITIDPPLALEWSAQYGGVFADGFRGIATDVNGLVYLTGYTNSFNFPTFNRGGTSYYDGVYNGAMDAMVMQIDSGQGLGWATYLGGPGRDFGNSIHVDALGNVYVTGGAEAGFPMQSLGGAYNQTVSAAQEAFVARFDATLTLQWSTFYGGVGNEEGLKIKTDNGSNIYVCGFTNSPTPSFPTQQYGSGYLQTNVIGNDAFMLKFDANGARQWATVYGGTGDDYATSLASDNQNNLVVSGFTTSNNFPVSTFTSPAYLQASSGGNTDGFILWFASNTYRINATYFGGSGSDYFTDITPDPSGNYFLTGRTSSANFPLQPAPGFGFNQTSNHGSYDALIVKCRNDLSLYWSTYYGGSDIDGGTGVVCDDAGRLYITGFTFSNDFPLDSPLFAGAWYQPVYKGNSDGFIGGFTNLGANFWSTYKGDTCYEYPADIAFDTLYNKFYIAGEGLYTCNCSFPDTGMLHNGASIADAFAWAFDDGTGAPGGGGGGGGGGGAPDCFEVLLDGIIEPCPNLCNGSARMAPVSGYPPFEAIWSSGETTDLASQLCAGEQWVQVRDATGCVSEARTTLMSMTVYGSSEGVGCWGDYGSATAVAFGGTGPYTYLWQDGTTLETMEFITSGGDYYVTVTDARGCVSETGVYVPWDNYQTGSLELISPPTCGMSNGIITGTDMYGPNPVWSVATNDTSYYISADTLYNIGFETWYSLPYASGCEFGTPYSLYYFIDSMQTSDFWSSTSNPSNCNSENGLIILSDLNYMTFNYPLSFQWSTGAQTEIADNLSVGDYTITITDVANCSVTMSFHLSSQDSLTVNFNNSNIILASCQNDSSGGFSTPTITGGTGPYSYLWSTGDTVCPISNLAVGNYAVTLTDANGCTASQSNIELAYSNASYIAFDSIAPECFGASNGFIIAQVVADFGTPPYSYGYRWSNGVSGNQINNITTGTYTVTVTGNGGQSYNACITLPTAINQFSTQIHTSPYDCLTGNEANAIITGGTSPYSYWWTNGNTTVTNAMPFSGQMVLQVTDVYGCVAVDTDDIQIATPFTASYSLGEVICHGDATTLDITASGGFTPYGGTGNYVIPAGTYNYPVTDSMGCLLNLQFTVAEPSALNVGYSASDILCFGGSSAVDVWAAGGVPPYTGTGNFTLNAGSYNYSVIDSNGCSESLSFQLSDPEPLQIEANYPPITCWVDTLNVNITATGGTFPYQGIGILTFTTDTLFAFSVTDFNGCHYDSVINIDLINDSIVTTLNNTTVCPHALLAFSVANDILNPVWYPGGITGHDYNISNLLTDTIVTMIGTNPDGCAISETYNVSMEECNTTGVAKTNETGFKVYPNPASSFVTIELTGEGRYSAVLFDAIGKIAGQLLYHQLAGQYRFNLENLASGLYYVSLVEHDSSQVIIRKLVVE